MWLSKRRNKRKKEPEGNYKNNETQLCQEPEKKLEELETYKQLNKSEKDATLFDFSYFSIVDENLEEELNKEGPVQERLKEKFKTEGFPLSETATIKKEYDGKWLITDKENKKILIRKDKETLNIYYSTKEEIIELINHIMPEVEDRINNMKKLNGRVIKHCPYLYIYGLIFVDPKITFVSFTNSDKLKLCITSMPQNNWLERIKEGIRRNDEIEIENIGKDLWESIRGDIQTMLKELQKDNENNIWIFYEGKDIEYPWEWIHWGFNDDKFYWGDKFHIVRIPAKAPKFQDRNFRINNVAILRDRTCNHISKDKNCLNCLSNDIKEKNLNNSGELINLNVNFDYIHLVADRGSFEDSEYLNAIGRAETNKNNKHEIQPRGEGLAGDTNNSKILFLNISKSNSNRHRSTGYIQSMQDIRRRLLNLIPVETWIYTNLDVPDDFAPIFAKYFYNVFPITEKNMVKAVTEARKNINNDINDIHKFYRFTYIVCGNPNINVTETAN